jgi:hypothetical protein
MTFAADIRERKQSGATSPLNICVFDVTNLKPSPNLTCLIIRLEISIENFICLEQYVVLFW